MHLKKKTNPISHIDSSPGGNISYYLRLLMSMSYKSEGFFSSDWKLLSESFQDQMMLGCTVLYVSWAISWKQTLIHIFH